MLSVKEKNLCFMCIGAQKSGTTWLYEQLDKHPQVEMPPLKEIHYFDEIHRNVKTSLSARFFDKHWMNARWRKINKYLLIKLAKFNVREAKWFIRYLYSKRDWEWYDKLFQSSEEKISGDITPDYAVLNENLINEIILHYPNIKVIFLMRNPVERKWSHIKMVLGEKRKRHFSEVLEEEYLFACENWKDDIGNYPETIKSWQKHVGKSNFFIGFYDDLREDPVELYRNILKFLDINPIFDEKELKKVVYGGSNASIPPEAYNIILNQKIQEIDELKRMLGNIPATWPSRNV